VKINMALLAGQTVVEQAHIGVLIGICLYSCRSAWNSGVCNRQCHVALALGGIVRFKPSTSTFKQRRSGCVTVAGCEYAHNKIKVDTEQRNTSPTSTFVSVILAAVFELEITIEMGVVDAFMAGRVTLQLPSASAVASTLTKSKGQHEKINMQLPDTNTSNLTGK
jgi:hypothetical protein